MHRSLYWKLTLAFMLVAVTTAGLVALMIRFTSADRLTQLILDQQRSQIQASLAEYYTTNGSWDGIERQWRQLQSQAQALTQPQGQPQPTPAVVRPTPLPDSPQSYNRDRRSFFGLADTQGVVLISVDPSYPVGAKLPDEKLSEGLAVTVNSKQVGTILTQQLPQPGFNPEETLFLERTYQALFLAVLIALLFALVLGFVLARTLTHPLQALTSAAERIAAGQLEQQVKVTSQDEIGQLARAFNLMSQNVARANHMRRQMTADIAHDLRTPLTVIAGYVESMRDGVLRPTTERLALIYEEIERLQDLVGDLRLLSQADAGELPLNPQAIAPCSLLERAAAVFQHKAGQQSVTMSVQAAEDLPELEIDEARMLQVLDNLISNALRYTPAGGKITLAARQAGDKLVLSVQDTGSGIAPQELPHIFDRFYRADPSRHTDTGESGLGLAIVKALVEAHHARVWAESTVGSGTSILIEFPLAA